MPQYDRKQIDRWRWESRLVEIWAYWPAILLPALVLLAVVLKLWGQP